MENSKRTDALNYHKNGRPGKIQVVPTKPYSTQRDLSLAYSPGVAIPCLEIEKNPQDAYEYTAKGNLVAVISNGTAVLGLGDIGALAGKPVPEVFPLLLPVQQLLLLEEQLVLEPRILHLIKVRPDQLLIIHLLALLLP